MRVGTDLVATIVTGGTAGLIAALVMVIALILKGTLVPGYVYQANLSKLTRFEEIAFKAMAIAERATSKDGAR